MTTDPQTIAWLDQEAPHLAQVPRPRRWAVQYVGPGDGTHEPAFAYTIGLFGLGHPELVVVSLSPTVADALLEAVAELVDDGRDFAPGYLLPVANQERRLVVEELTNPGEVVLAANRFYQ